MKKYVLILLAVFFLYSCKKDPIEPTIESPFIVRYSLELSSPITTPGSVSLLDQNSKEVFYSVTDAVWNQSFTITNTQRPIILQLKSRTGFPFNFDKTATLKASIFVNESLMATITKESTSNQIANFELTYNVK